MNLVTLANSVLGIQGYDVSTLLWVLPIVGITVVLSGLIVLALILKMFIKLNPEAKAAAASAPAPARKDEAQPEAKKEAEAGEEDEIVAIATALNLFVFHSEGAVNLTEQEQDFNTSPWNSANRVYQNDGYNRWQSQKKWGK